jgi:hypothetical protein
VLHRQRSLDALLPYWPAIVIVAAVGLWTVVAGRRAALAAGVFGRYVLLWAATPVLFAFAGSWLRNGAFNVRYVLIALPAFLLVTALALTAGSPRRFRVGTAILVAISLASLARERADPRYAREDVRTAAHWLAAHVAPDDRVLVSCAYMRSGLGFYDDRVPYEALPVVGVRTAADAAANLDAVTMPARPTWLVLTREWEDDPGGMFRAAFADAIHTAPDAEFPGVRVYRFAPTAVASPRP